ncbi:Transcription initiation factor IIB [Smittium mucronatum]|uniref:Transcription initiation factor IIB n=1 Tax=Smittium mucronatum TaxID=133383 RepID=A0A1R0GR25_9FUNG|nr:Transcription initiation factor IIB [Smittium mucronatum]
MASPNISSVPPVTPSDLRINVVLVCPDCKSGVPNIVEEFASGDLVCGDCGLVLGDRIIDTRSEWRTFANDEGDDPSRVGNAANPFLDGAQLDTIIARSGDGGSGLARDLNKIHGKNTAQKHEKNLIQAYKEIIGMCDAIDLPKSIGDVAKQLYKEVEDNKLLRGRSNESIIAACIFIACRQENVPRTFKEICALTRVPKRDIGRVVKELQRLLKTNVGGMSSEDLMSRFCSNLSLGMDVQRIAIILSTKAKNLGTLAGKSPVSIAAACIFFATNLLGSPTESKNISNTTGVSEVTIKNTYKQLFIGINKLLDDDFFKSYPKASLSNLPSP